MLVAMVMACSTLSSRQMPCAPHVYPARKRPKVLGTLGMLTLVLGVVQVKDQCGDGYNLL